MSIWQELEFIKQCFVLHVLNFISCLTLTNPLIQRIPFLVLQMKKLKPKDSLTTTIVQVQLQKA